eukprot:EG_transcript_13064
MKRIREEALASWLQYWQNVEAKIQQSCGDSLAAEQRDLSADRVPTSSLTHSTTPDRVKVEVLWELYWSLRAQHILHLKEYSKRWLSLIATRRKMMESLVACERHDGMNDGQPSTLAAVDAEIFIEALREPRFNYAPSKEIKYSELVRLSNSTGMLMSSGHNLVHISPFSLAFLKSPLCTEPAFMRRRSAMSGGCPPSPRWKPPPPEIAVDQRVIPIPSVRSCPVLRPARLPSLGELPGHPRPSSGNGTGRTTPVKAKPRLSVRTTELVSPTKISPRLRLPHLPPDAVKGATAVDSVLSPSWPGPLVELEQRRRRLLMDALEAAPGTPTVAYEPLPSPAVRKPRLSVPQVSSRRSSPWKLEQRGS